MTERKCMNDTLSCPKAITSTGIIGTCCVAQEWCPKQLPQDLYPIPKPPIDERSITRGEADYIIKQEKIINARLNALEADKGKRLRELDERIAELEKTICPELISNPDFEESSVYHGKPEVPAVESTPEYQKGVDDAIADILIKSEACTIRELVEYFQDGHKDRFEAKSEAPKVKHDHGTNLLFCQECHGGLKVPAVDKRFRCHKCNEVLVGYEDNHICKPEAPAVTKGYVPCESCVEEVVKPECKHPHTVYATDGQLWCEDCHKLIGKPSYGLTCSKCGKIFQSYDAWLNICQNCNRTEDKPVTSDDFPECKESEKPVCDCPSCNKKWNTTTDIDISLDEIVKQKLPEPAATEGQTLERRSDYAAGWWAGINAYKREHVLPKDGILIERELLQDVKELLEKSPVYKNGDIYKAIKQSLGAERGSKSLSTGKTWKNC